MSSWLTTEPFKRYLFFGKEVLVKRILCMIILSGLLISTGCHKVTEFDSAFNGGLYVISSQDFTTSSYISGIKGARSLLVYPGTLIVASTEGIVYRYDSESMTLIEECVVGSPSPSGFTQMTLNASSNSAYLIGSLGQIVEFSLPDCIVEDVFTVCQSPVVLAIAPGDPPYLYVADGPSHSINQVSTVNNTLLTSVQSFYTINCIEPGWNADTILVGTSTGLLMVLEYGPGAVSAIGGGIAGGVLALAAIPNDSSFVLVSNSTVGVLEFYPDAPPGELYADVVDAVSLEGSNHLVAMGTDWQHAYVLSYMGDFTCRLTSYNYVFGRIDQQVDFPGFPLDIKTTSSGIIYVLTYE